VTFRRIRLLGCLAAAWLASAGCTPSTVGTLSGAVAAAEVFRFDYLKLDPDASGRYALPMDLGNGSGCQNHLFDRYELSDMLHTRQFPAGRVVGNLTFSFDQLSACSPNEVRFETDQLVELVRDDTGNVTGRRRPENEFGAHLVDVALHSDGVLDVHVYDEHILGQTASRSRAPGALAITVAEVPAAHVNGPTGAVYAAANANPAYTEGSLDQILANPSRFTATFSFLANTSPGSSELLLVWDGEMVLRTDL